MGPFAYLFNKYWANNVDVDVLCESTDIKLPKNFKMRPIDVSNGSWPKEQWSDGLIKYLESISESFVVIMLDDYWLSRHVDVHAVNLCLEYMSRYRSIIRIDLTLDRLFAGVGPIYPSDDKEHDTHGYLDFVSRHGTPYQMSLMPGIWNKKLLLDILQPKWTPWDVEIDGTTKLNKTSWIVLGTRQRPVKMTNGLRNERECIDVDDIKPQDLKIITKMFPEGRSICQK